MFDPIADPWTGNTFTFGPGETSGDIYAGVFELDSEYSCGDYFHNMLTDGQSYNTMKIQTVGNNTTFLLNSTQLCTTDRINLVNKLGFIIWYGEYKVDYIKITKN